MRFNFVQKSAGSCQHLSVVLRQAAEFALHDQLNFRLVRHDSSAQRFRVIRDVLGHSLQNGQPNHVW